MTNLLQNIKLTNQTIPYLKPITDQQYSRSLKQLGTVKRLLDTWKPKSMLDIGCGLGMSSLMIAKYSQMEYLGLLDGDGSGELFHDYRSDALAWNNVRVAGALARDNLGRKCKVETFIQGQHPVKIPVDLIVSFKSWGTHYPVATYLPLAAESLENGGHIVLDLRPDDEDFRAGQRDEFYAAGFRLVERAGDRRHVFERVA